MGLNVTHKKSRTKSYAVETEIRRSSDSELELSHEVHVSISDYYLHCWHLAQKSPARKKNKVPPRLELGLLDSESNVLTARPWNLFVHLVQLVTPITADKYPEGSRSESMEKRKEKRIRSDDSDKSDKDVVSKRGRGRRCPERDMHTAEKGLTCHQCKNLTDKVNLVFCSKCTKKRYCYDCIKKW
ncbi:hypothetical protein YC2023_029480 [Brassica napus]